MGIEETLGLIPKGVFLLAAEGGDLFHGRGGILALSVDEDRLQDLFHCICASGKLRLLPCCIGIEQKQVLGGIVLFVHKTDQIGADLAGLLVVDPVDRLVAGIGDLFSVLGNLDLRHEITVLVLDCCELVHAAEGRAVLGSDQVGPHAPGRDGGTLDLQVVDQQFVQIIGCGDDRIGKSCRVQHLSRFFGEVCQVAGIQTDAVALRLDPCVAHLLEDTDRVGNAGF